MKALEEKEREFKDKILVDVSRLAKEFNCSREGMYSYIKHFVNGYDYKIPSKPYKFLKAVGTGKAKDEWQQYQLLQYLRNQKE